VQRTWKDIAHTIGQFARDPGSVGTVIPSSRFLARRMMNAADISQAKVVLEIGAGTGAITRELLKHANTNAKIIIVDNNIASIEILRARLAQAKQVTLVHGNALNIREILNEHSIEKVDSLVSSLPYTSLGSELTKSILQRASQVLSPQGHFVAFQYTPVIKKTIELYFTIERTEFEFRNFPPAIVYSCVPKTHSECNETLKISA
jgi:phospholipid N-methyltransferase